MAKRRKNRRGVADILREMGEAMTTPPGPRNSGDGEGDRRKAEVALSMYVADPEGTMGLIFDGKAAGLVENSGEEFVAVNAVNNAQGSGPTVAAALFRLMESSLGIHGLGEQRDDRERLETAEAIFCARCEAIQDGDHAWGDAVALAYAGFYAIEKYLEESSAHAADHVRRLKVRYNDLVRADPVLRGRWERVKARMKADGRDGAEESGPRVVIVPPGGLGEH